MFNLRLAADYLLYRLRANSRHGTHSPFVYRLVDEVIYDFHAKKVYQEVEENRKATGGGYAASLTPKLAHLLYRLVADWQPSSIIITGAIDPITQTYLRKAAPDVPLLNVEDRVEPTDVIFISNVDDVYQIYQLCLPKVSDRTMMIITNIYQDKSAKDTWAKIKTDPRVIVTIDLFAIGLVYFRKGQVKEDFTIRF